MIWLIGSKAVQHYLKGKMYRRCADTDLMCSPEDLCNIQKRLLADGVFFMLNQSTTYAGKYKLHIAGADTFEIDTTENESRIFLTETGNVPSSTTSLTHIGEVCIPSLDMLYAIKRAHAGLPVHTDKTLLDLIKLGKMLFANEPGVMKLHEDEQHLFNLLKSEAVARDANRKARINFNKPAKDFFKQSEAFRQYTHDKVHDMTCRWSAPLFRDNLKYADRALIDMPRFMNRPLEYRLTMVQEEAIVIGIERAYLDDRTLRADVVYRLGLTKLVRDLSKGAFQEFMLEHMHLLSKTPDWQFLERFNQAEHEGYFNET